MGAKRESLFPSNALQLSDKSKPSDPNGGAIPQKMGFLGFPRDSRHGRSYDTNPRITLELFEVERLDRFWQFIYERQRLWQKRFFERSEFPWTADPILKSVHFTNVYRELDPGTQYALASILERSAPKPDKVFNVMLYRLIGREETHSKIGFQFLSKFSPRELERSLKNIRHESTIPIFTGAYTVSAFSGMGSDDKVENVVRLLDLLHRRFNTFYNQLAKSSSAERAFRNLCNAYGFGVFLAYQVLVDLLYPLDSNNGKPLLPFSHDDWAAAGPGARKGILALVKTGVKTHDLDVMRWLRANQDSEFARLGLRFPFLRDLSGNGGS